MGASIDRIRRGMKVAPTPQDAGLTLTLTVTAYDNGMLVLDGAPINEPRALESDWLGTLAVIASTLEEFRRQVAARQRERAS